MNQIEIEQYKVGLLELLDKGVQKKQALKYLPKKIAYANSFGSKDLLGI